MNKNRRNRKYEIGKTIKIGADHWVIVGLAYEYPKFGPSMVEIKIATPMGGTGQLRFPE